MGAQAHKASIQATKNNQRTLADVTKGWNAASRCPYWVTEVRNRTSTAKRSRP